MQTFGAFLVSTLCATLAAGAALPSSPAGSFEVHQTRNENFSGRNGPAALAKAYNKWGMKVPEALSKALEKQNIAKRVSGSVTATSVEGDLEYQVNVQIGTPAKTFKLDFDSGSSDLWVFSTEMSSGTSGHTLYNPSGSSTSKVQSGETWKIAYGDGSSASGNIYTDVVTVGSLTVKSQAVEAAKKASSAFTSGTNDGLLGLAFDNINTASPRQVQTWFGNIAPSLTQNLFVADLRHDTAGSYTFGAIPSAATNIHYASVNPSQGFWQFSAKPGVGGESSTTCIADTGTTLLLVDDDVLDGYYDQMETAEYSDEQGGVIFDCSETPPSYSFTVGGGKITVPGSYINYGANGDGTCFGGIQSNQGEGFSIYGDVALKAAYVVFDNGNQRVGWSQKV